MTLLVILNAILCGAVVVMVAAPLVWAILTQQRDEPAGIAAVSRTRRAPADARRRARRPRHAPIGWPAQ
jgi:hypothetical protein